MKFIDKDGSLNGWVVSAVFTLLTMTLLTLGFFITTIADNWVKIGGSYSTIYISSLGIWFGYKTIKTFSGGGINTTT